MEEPAQKRPRDRAQTLIASASRLIQQHGYNGFSYRDLADEIGIKTASIHYHFPTKPDLAAACARDYAERFSARLSALRAASTDPVALFDGYGVLFGAALIEDGLVCLCGMLAAESSALPEPVQNELTRFFDDQIAWLAETISAGQAEGVFRKSLCAETFAGSYVYGLEGAMIVARSLSDRSRFLRTQAQFRDLLLAPDP